MIHCICGQTHVGHEATLLTCWLPWLPIQGKSQVAGRGRARTLGELELELDLAPDKTAFRCFTGLVSPLTKLLSLGGHLAPILHLDPDC